MINTRMVVSLMWILPTEHPPFPPPVNCQCQSTRLEENKPEKIAERVTQVGGTERTLMSNEMELLCGSHIMAMASIFINNKWQRSFGTRQTIYSVYLRSCSAKANMRRNDARYL